MKFGIQLALGGGGSRVVSSSCSKDDGPFTCVLCSCPLTLRAGSKSPKHFIHKKKADCEGNTDEHRRIAESIGSIGGSSTETRRAQDVESEQIETKTGSVYDMKPQLSKTSPDDMIDEALDMVLEIMEPKKEPGSPGSITEPQEPQDLVKEPQEQATIPMDVSAQVIEDALDFVAKEVLKETRCTDCKISGSGHHQMFTEEAMVQFGLNDLYVCDSCLVRCPACDGPNSARRERRTKLCFKCDFDANQWRESAEEAVEKMKPIPDSPKWMTDTRCSMVLKMICRKTKARTIYNFMVENRSRMVEYKDYMGAQAKARSVKKALERERRQRTKRRVKNENHRERAMGPQATERFNIMYANKRELCASCGSQGKRRHMVKYSSVLGSYRYCCSRCSTACPCGDKSTSNDLQKFNGECFECFTYRTYRENLLKTDEKSLLNACLDGKAWALATLYMHSPMVSKGRFNGDLLVHVPSSEMDSVIRRDHNEFKEIGKVILRCRKQ